MKHSGFLTLTVLAAGLALGDERPRPPERATTPLPPVLRNAEAEDSVIVTLPGTPQIVFAPITPPPSPETLAAGTAASASAQTAPDPDADLLFQPEMGSALAEILHQTPVAPTPAAIKNFRRVLPEDMQINSGVFLQKRIGQWSEADARSLLGEPASQRPAFDESHVENGRILAFADPTDRYKQIELDFDSTAGRMRTVFLYPRNLTWVDCRHEFGGKVNAALAQKGRKFYSFLDRRLDVLVDPAGKVVSLGLY